MARQSFPATLGPGVPVTFTDSHAHFDTFVETGMLDDILRRAAAAGVSRMVAIGGGPESNARAARLAREHPDRLRAAVGYDRDLAGSETPMDPLLELLREPGVAAVGETGLDYHYAPETAPVQRELFARMLDAARTAGRPVVIHSRDADDDTVELLRRHAPPRGGVLHCFTGGLGFARRLLDLGLYIGFSGIVTFKNAESLREVARFVPGDRLLIETDAPYLAPVPHRGKTNEPAWVVHVAEMLASVRGVALEEVARQTAANAARLFGFSEELS